MRRLLRNPASLLVLGVAFGNACSPATPADAPDAGDDVASPDAGPDAGEPGCDDAACLIDLHEEVKSTCDPARLAELIAGLEARRGSWPLWHGGRALFVTDEPAQVAGAFNEWRADAEATATLCGSGLS